MGLGGALGPVWSRMTPRHFAWQAWHNLTSTFVLHGRRGAISHPPSFCEAGVVQMALGGALGLGLGARDAAAFCVAGVAQTHIHLRFAWQAWHNLTSTFVLRGRRGTHGTGWRAWAGLVADDAAALCVAGVAQPHIHLRFAWQAWHNLTSTFLLRGRRGRRGTHGTGWRAWAGLVADDAAALCVAGVAQPHIHLRFAWQAWHNLTSTFVLRGRRGTHGTGWRAWAGLVADDAAALCVAGVAQSHILLRFTWQAWHNPTSTFVLRGRRGTHGTGWRAWAGLVADDAAALCVAGVAQPHIHLRFAWQAWHNLTSTFVLRGRRGTHGTGWRAWAGLVADDAAALCVAGVVQLTSTFVLHGRRGTISHPPSFCVAGVALTGLGGALGPVWSRMTPRHFAWQAWHNLTSTFVLHGRRGTISHPPSFCVAGVALMGLGGALGPVWSRMTPRHFAWQAWHNLTSAFVSRGRRGTIPHPPSFCVAGVALGDIHLRFAWQAWHLANIHLCFVTYHTIFVTHDFVTHHLSHIIFDTPSWTHHLSHHFVTHHL